MEELEPKVRGKCLRCREALGKLQGDLAPVFASGKAGVQALPLLDQARLKVALALAATSVLQMYMRTQGEVCPNQPNHPVHGYARQVHKYLEKLKEATDSAERKTTVNPEAANRLLRHTLGSEGDGRQEERRRAKARKPPVGDAKATDSLPSEAQTEASPSAKKRRKKDDAKGVAPKRRKEHTKPQNSTKE